MEFIWSFCYFSFTWGCFRFWKKGIWVYENDKLVEGSPFVSLRQAALAINSPNSTKSFKVDTGILFKGKYTFYSKPKNNF